MDKIETRQTKDILDARAFPRTKGIYHRGANSFFYIRTCGTVVMLCRCTSPKTCSYRVCRCVGHFSFDYIFRYFDYSDVFSISFRSQPNFLTFKEPSQDLANDERGRKCASSASSCEDCFWNDLNNGNLYILPREYWHDPVKGKPK